MAHLHMNDLALYIEQRVAELISISNKKHQDEVDALKNKLKSQADIIHSIEYVINHQTTVTNLLLDKIVKMETKLSTLNKWVEYAEGFINQNIHDISDLKIEFEQNDKNIEKISKMTADAIETSAQSRDAITEIKSYLKNTDELFVNFKNNTRWAQEIQQCHHQYALEKFNSLQNNITIIKRDNDDKIREIVKQSILHKTECETKFAEFTKQIMGDTVETIKIPAQKLISLDNLEPAVQHNVQSIDNVNSDDCYDCYDDDEHMFVIIKEES